MQPSKPFQEAENNKKQLQDSVASDPPKKKYKPISVANMEYLSDKQKLEVLKTLENEPEVSRRFISE